MAFSSATQLRVGLVGPSEALLIVWLAVGSISLLWARKVRPGPAFSPFVPFWVLSFGTLIGGLLIASYLGHVAADPVRDFIAYLFSMALVFVYCTGTDLSRALVTARWFAVFSTLLLAGILTAALLDFHIPLIDPWDDFRFKGWARNPNQLALQTALCTVYLLVLWKFSRSHAGRAFIILGILINLAIGIFTFSDALFVSWVFGALVLIIASLHFFLVDDSAPRFAYRVIVATLGFGAVFALVYFYRFASEAIGDLAGSIYGNANQGDIRLALWRHGLEAISTSPILGLGPGAHSGDTSPFQGKEAHNSFIDWAMSTGLLGVALLVWLWMRIFRRAVTTKSTAVIGGLAILAVFCQFHHALRHPVFWFGLVFLYLVADKERFGRDERKTTLPRPGEA